MIYKKSTSSEEKGYMPVRHESLQSYRKDMLIHKGKKS